MVTKVVYNVTYGHLADYPDEIVEQYNKLAGTNYEDGWSMDNVPRHDPILVRLIEEYNLKMKNNSLFSVKEITGNRYFIQSHDGFEEVIEPEDITWIKVEN